jgi:multicomponent Na+:H+ antiporter subunit D
MGVPPSGGFAAKWLLLLASAKEGQWCWALVMLAGGLLAGGYVFIVLGKALGGAGAQYKLCMKVSRTREIVALTVALCAVLLSLLPLEPSRLLQIGRPAVLGMMS